MSFTFCAAVNSLAEGLGPVASPSLNVPKWSSFTLFELCSSCFMTTTSSLSTASTSARFTVQLASICSASLLVSTVSTITALAYHFPNCLLLELLFW